MRRSKYGGFYLLNDGPSEWKSKMSQIVVLSSMETGYIGAEKLVRIGVWLRRCLEKLGCPSCGPTTIGCDNKSAIVFANESIIQNRSKLIDTTIVDFLPYVMETGKCFFIYFA